MAKSKKKSKKSAGPLNTTTVRLLLWALVLGLFGTALWLAGGTAWSRVAAREEFLVRPARDFDLTEWPAWVQRGAMRAELAGYIAEHTPPLASIFYPAGPAYVGNDPAPPPRSLPEMVAESLQNCPWISAVHGVSRELPDRLRLDVQFREPAGIVSWLGRSFLVDIDGQYLGADGDLFVMPAAHRGRNAPIIMDRRMDLRSHDIMAQNPFDPRWPAARLAVGARLHLFLQQHGAYDEVNVARIDVTWVGRNAGNTYVGGRPQAEVTLYTREGLEIRWGRTSAYDSITGIDEPPSRDPDELKLQRLRTIVAKHPEFPQLDAPVDLRWERNSRTAR
jgi:hypothetical protein